MKLFETNSEDLGYSEVRTLGEAVEKLNELKIPFVNAVEIKYKPTENGVHVYFIDMYGNELAYYTPIMNSLMVRGKPIFWSEEWKSKCVSVPLNR